MIFDNYVWSGDALWVAIETVTQVLLIGGRCAAPAMDDANAGCANMKTEVGT